MTSQDFVNSATEAQMKLHADVRRDEWPDPGEDIIERRVPFLVALVGWMIAGAAMWLAIMWALGWLAAANAAEREPRVWQMWAAGSDKPFHPHKFTSFTACLTDIAFVRDDGGKRLSCVRIDQRKGE